MTIRIMPLKNLVLFTLTCVLVYSCGTGKKEETKPTKTEPAKTTPVVSYSLVKKHPHDTSAFTEGLLFHDQKLYESTAGTDYLANTKSAFGIVDLEKGKLDIKAELDKKIYFGEGIIILNGKLYQLTYKNQLGFIYDAKTYKKLGQFTYPNKEGWGLTTDGRYIIMSDGTYNLTYLDPSDLKVVKVLAVTENGYAADRLNELEYIKGFIYANIWMTNTIVKIDPKTGKVMEKIELDDLYEEAKTIRPVSLEMNGIAYDSIADKIMVTGKLWPHIYEIDFPH